MRERAGEVANRARRARFRRLVDKALRGLPPEIATQLDNVEIIVEDEPTVDQCNSSGQDCGELFGLYEGIPLIERGSEYTMVLPDRIIIFRGPLERAFPNQRDLEYQARITVMHELAHHLGFDEEAMDRLGLE